MFIELFVRRRRVALFTRRTGRYGLPHNIRISSNAIADGIASDSKTNAHPSPPTRKYNVREFIRYYILSVPMYVITLVRRNNAEKGFTTITRTTPSLTYNFNYDYRLFQRQKHKAQVHHLKLFTL